MRSDIDQSVIDIGETMSAFKKTQYYRVMVDFSIEKVKQLRGEIVLKTMDGDSEAARDLAQQLKGFQLFLDYIDSSISAKEEIYEEERELKGFGKSLPHRL